MKLDLRYLSKHHIVTPKGYFNKPHREPSFVGDVLDLAAG